MTMEVFGSAYRYLLNIKNLFTSVHEPRQWKRNPCETCKITFRATDNYFSWKKLFSPQKHSPVTSAAAFSLGFQVRPTTNDTTQWRSLSSKFQSLRALALHACKYNCNQDQEAFDHLVKVPRSFYASAS
jgi:hypothetical protein